MSFIGIVAENKDFDFIKHNILEKIYNQKQKIDIIKINKRSLENLKNIKFETIIINTKLKDIEKNESYIENILKNSKYLIINSDIQMNKETFKNISLKIITYGLNQKATITASSITQDEVLICLQRNIEDINNNIIEAQEFNVKKDNENIYNILAIYTILKIYNVKI